jgi:hypothetical protein
VSELKLTVSPEEVVALTEKSGLPYVLAARAANVIVWPKREELRGSGLPAAKSMALSSVSVWPLPLRIAAVVLVRVGAAPGPSKQLVLAP